VELELDRPRSRLSIVLVALELPIALEAGLEVSIVLVALELRIALEAGILADFAAENTGFVHWHRYIPDLFHHHYILDLDWRTPIGRVRTIPTVARIADCLGS